MLYHYWIQIIIFFMELRLVQTGNNHQCQDLKRSCEKMFIIIIRKFFPDHAIIDIEQCFGIIFSFFLLSARHLKIFTTKKKRVNCYLILTNGYVIIGRKICSLLLFTFLVSGLSHFC